MKSILTTLLLLVFVSVIGQDFDGPRPEGSSSEGINLLNYYNTNIQLTAITHSGSHGILFNAYKAAVGVSGSLGTTGNVKYANSFTDHSTGAGGIIFYGNGGNLDFVISPQSTGQHTNVVWGIPKMRIMRNGNVGIGTSGPSEKLSVEGNILIDAFNNGSENGLFFRQDFTSTNKYNLSILNYDDGDGSPDALMINAYDGIYFNTGSNNRNTQMSISHTGDVGIGVEVASEKLEVDGNVKVDRLITRKSSFSLTGGTSSNGWLRDDWLTGNYGPARWNYETSTWDRPSGTYNDIGGILWQDEGTYFIRERHGAQLSFTNSELLTKAFLFADMDKNIGIGTNNPDSKLTVKGSIHAEEVKVDLSVPGPDYVFESDYDLKSLEEIEAYIKAEKHLPEIPSAKEMEANGVQLGEMNMLLLKKIEELTLHTIAQEKKINELEPYPSLLKEREAKHGELEKKIEELMLYILEREKRIEKLENQINEN